MREREDAVASARALAEQAAAEARAATEEFEHEDGRSPRRGVPADGRDAPSGPLGRTRPRSIAADARAKPTRVAGRRARAQLAAQDRRRGPGQTRCRTPTRIWPPMPTARILRGARASLNAQIARVMIALVTPTPSSWSHRDGACAPSRPCSRCVDRAPARPPVARRRAGGAERKRRASGARCIGEDLQLRGAGRGARLLPARRRSSTYLADAARDDPQGPDRRRGASTPRPTRSWPPFDARLRRCRPSSRRSARAGQEELAERARAHDRRYGRRTRAAARPHDARDRHAVSAWRAASCSSTSAELADGAARATRIERDITADDQSRLDRALHGRRCGHDGANGRAPLRGGAVRRGDPVGRRRSCRARAERVRAT